MMMTTNPRLTVSVDEATATHDGSQEQLRDVWSAEGVSVYQPIIGIPILAKQGSQGPVFMADAVGAWAIARMRARVLLIPLWPFPAHAHIYQSLWSLIQAIDGLLLPAGVQEV